MSPQENLFVYGTLRRNSTNPLAVLLARSAHFLAQASVQGRIYMIENYPGLALSSDRADRVHGDIYRLNDASATYRELDEYEGSDFERVVVPVLLNTGQSLHACAYIYTQSISAKRRIDSGEWNSGNFPNESVV